MITTSKNSEEDKVKIGIDCESLNKSRWGVARLVLNLLKEYEKNLEWQKRFKLYLYFQTKIPNDKFLHSSIFTIRAIKPFIKDSFNIYYHLLMPIKTTRDGLNWMFFPSYMLPPLYMRRSIVLLTGDVHRKNTKGTLPFRYRLAYELFSKWASIAATKIMAISRASKTDIVRLLKTSPNKIFVAHLGVNMSPFFAQGFEGQQTKGRYLLFVGQALPRRRLKETILAFEKIAPEFLDLKFIVTGTDKYNPPIINNLIAETNKKLGEERIIYYDYIGKNDDLEKLYRNAFLFVYVSSSEAFGLPPVEAAAHGIPVVVKDDALNHELFEDAAFFVDDEKNPNNIAEALRQGLFNREKRGYCNKRYKEIIPRFNWQNFATKFFQIIEK